MGRPRICSQYCGGTVRGIIERSGPFPPGVRVTVTENPPWTWRFRKSWVEVRCVLHHQPFYVHAAYTLGPDALPRDERGQTA